MNMKGNSWTNLLVRGLKIPVWLLSVITLALFISAGTRIEIPPLVLAFLALTLIIIGFFADQKKDTAGTRQLSDDESAGHTITVSNFPSFANPTLLKIADRKALKNIKADPEIGVISSIAGDLVFEVNRFDAPIELVLNYTKEDERALVDRQEFLKKTGARYQEVDLIPVYLETTLGKDGKSTTAQWKAFDEADFTTDPKSKTFVIKISKWGDQNIGVGTKT